MSIGEASSGSAGSIRITAGKLDLKEAEDDAETTPSGGAIALTSGKSTYGESGCITVRTADGGRSDDEYRTNSGSIHLATGTATGAGGSIIMEAGAGYGDTGCGGSLYLTAGDNLNEVPEENYAGGNIHISAGAGSSQAAGGSVALLSGGGKLATGGIAIATSNACLLYTSDAADE